MKKIWVMMLTGALAFGVLGGCGSNDGAASLKDLDVEKYVTLGEYKGLEVFVEPVSVDEADVDALVESAYSQQVTAESGGITDREVAVGDTVNIDYEGKEDGVAFDGGTAQGQNLTIGSGGFIEGFEDGLVGVMPGETVDLNLTFPEDYFSADMAGKEVVFTVTVNFIVPQVEEMEDSVIAGMGIEGVSTVEEFRQSAYDALDADAQNTYNMKLENQVLTAFMNSTVFKEIPKSMASQYQEMATQGLTQQAAGYGMDAETFAQQAYGMDFESLVEEYSLTAVKQDIALQAVANLENLNIDDEELNTILQEYASNAGFDTVEEFMGENSREDYRNYLVCDKALDFLVENAVVKSE